MASLLGIATHAQKRAALVSMHSAAVTLEKGVADDFRGRPGKRQVTVLSREGWQAACQTVGVDLDWTARRANLLIEGLDLQQSAGRVLSIGDVKLLITKETDPCERMKEVHAGLYDALLPQWRGGVCCRVIQAGQIRVGDSVELLDE